MTTTSRNQAAMEIAQSISFLGCCWIPSARIEAVNHILKGLTLNENGQIIIDEWLTMGRRERQQVKNLIRQAIYQTPEARNCCCFFKSNLGGTEVIEQKIIPKLIQNDGYRELRA